jgi:hypothetical protein
MRPAYSDYNLSLYSYISWWTVVLAVVGYGEIDPTTSAYSDYAASSRISTPFASANIEPMVMGSQCSHATTKSQRL